jgi:alginate O-acetyltransferase complex protein AlgI
VPLSSFAYLVILLPIAVIGYRALRQAGHRAAAQWFLIAMSLLFYVWNGAQFLPLLVVSILGNYLVGRAIDRSSERRRFRWLLAGLVGNISILIAFKYVAFFAGTFRALGVPVAPIAQGPFPLGLSFFTIQQVMYLVDCYERLVPANGFRDHVSFVAFFPYLSIGPISRARLIVPQLRSVVTDLTQTAPAIMLIVIGLAKKVLIADNLARIVDAGYANPATLSTLESWVVTVAYTLQLYFDFSGYSDMAMGSALLLGIEIPRNFNVPYRSRSVVEFWQRWHISLSSFITTYLYTPIIRSMGKATRRTSAIATLIAMLIAGLWHGPAWTYVLFGCAHGLALVVNQFWFRRKQQLPVWLSHVCTLLFVNASFVIFRSPNVTTAFRMLRQLLPTAGLTMNSLAAALDPPTLTGTSLLVVAAALLSFLGPDSTQLAGSLVASRYRAPVLLLLTVACAVLMSDSQQSQFIYGQF